MARTDAALQQATELVLATPGVKYSNGFTGRNGATFTFATNAALMFLVLDDFEERHRLGQTIDSIAQTVRGKLAQIEEAQAFVFIPPPVRGMGAAAGFSMRLQDTLGMDPTEFARVTQEFVAESIAFLQLLYDLSLGLVRRNLCGDRLVKSRIELLTQGRDFLEALAGQEVLELAVGHLQAGEQRLGVERRGA